MSVRVFIVLIAPFVIALTIADRVWREVRSIPFYVYCDVAEELEAMRRAWRAKSLHPEDRP